MNLQLLNSLKERRAEIVQELDDIDRMLRRAELADGGNDGDRIRASVVAPEVQPTRPPLPRNVAPEHMHTADEEGPPLLTFDEVKHYVRADGARIWTEADVEQVNNERKIAWVNAKRLGQAISFTVPPEYPPGYGVEKVAVGARSAAGDECVKLDPRGFSIFVCHSDENHPAYIGDNPVRPGCPMCFMAGGGGSSIPIRGTRSTDIPGEEPF